MKRYDMESVSRGYMVDYAMKEDSDGEYVRYADAQEKLAAAERSAEWRLERAALLGRELQKLSNEVAGIMGMAESELRRVVGNTNVEVLQLRLDEAKKTLKSAGVE